MRTSLRYAFAIAVICLAVSGVLEGLVVSAESDSQSTALTSLLRKAAVSTYR